MNYKKKKTLPVKEILFVALFFLFLFFSVKRMVYVEGFVEDFFYSGMEEKENLELSFEQERIEELEEAKALLNLSNTLSDFTLESATVVRHDLSFWWDEILISKGRKDGIKEGMAVISGQGLIGRISKCNENTSSVQLLTSSFLENQVSVKVLLKEKEYAFGILQNKDGKLLMDGMDKDKKFEKGMKVVTSGLSDVFPAGIFVGTISEVTLDHYHVGQILEVELASDMEHITMVGVLKNARE